MAVAPLLPRSASVSLVEGPPDAVATKVLTVRLSDGAAFYSAAAGAFTGLTDAQLRASAVPVSGAFFQATQPVSGTFWQATQPVSGVFFQATQPVSLAASVAVTGTFWQATQPVSGTFFQATQPVSAAALPLPSGASTEATLLLIKAKTDNLDVALSTRAVTGLTDTQLRATAVPVSGTVSVGTVPVTGTFWQATQPVSIASMPSTPVTGTFWQATQPVSGTFFQATQPISAAALPLPSGASTSANQTTELASLANIDASTASLVTKATLPATATRTSVGASVTYVTLLAANAARKGATITNDAASASLRVALGDVAATGDFTALLLANGYYEVPFGYTGLITGIWTVAVGNARVTEITA